MTNPKLRSCFFLDVKKRAKEKTFQKTTRFYSLSLDIYYMTLLLPKTSPTFVKTTTTTMSSKSSSFSTTHQKHQKSVFLLQQHSRRRREHQRNIIVQSSKHHHNHHRSLRFVQTQHHHLKKTLSTKSVLRASSSKDETTTTEKNDETMKDVQVTLVDCVASDGAKMTKETRRNAEGSIEEMDNCRFVRHRFNW